MKVVIKNKKTEVLNPGYPIKTLCQDYASGLTLT